MSPFLTLNMPEYYYLIYRLEKEDLRVVINEALSFIFVGKLRPSFPQSFLAFINVTFKKTFPSLITFKKAKYLIALNTYIAG